MQSLCICEVIKVKKYVNGEYVEMTEEEVKELERQGKIYNAY